MNEESTATRVQAQLQASAAGEHERTETARMLYEALVERSPYLICLSDLDGTITFASNASHSILGYEPKELIGQAVGMIVDPDALNRAFEVLTTALAGEEVLVDRMPLRHKDGTMITTETTMAIVKDVADVPLVLTTSRTPNAPVHQSANRLETIGQMSGAIAHDFNNLLLPMLGYAQLALMQIGDDQPNLRHHLENIQNAAERSRDLIRRLLEFSEPETALAIEPISLDDVVESALPLLQMLLGAGVRVEHVSNPTLPLCDADPTRITQLVMNLAANSRDALPAQDAVVRIATGYTVSNGSSNGKKPVVDHVTLTFTDNGSGMDETTKARVFEPYFTTKGERGTGLGLATVKRIVHDNGGTIELESSAGQGASFVITLPAS